MDLQEQYLQIKRIHQVEIDDQAPQTLSNKMEVTLEMDVTVWSHIKDLYKVNKIISKKKTIFIQSSLILHLSKHSNYVSYTVLILELLVHLAYTKKFVTHINQLCQVYLFQEIQ